MKEITVRFTNGHDVNVTLRGKFVDNHIDRFDVCGDAVYVSKSDNLDDITTYDADGIRYFPFYFWSRGEYGEDYEVHAYESPSKKCWVVSHITMYDEQGELSGEIGGRTQEITIKIK